MLQNNIGLRGRPVSRDYSIAQRWEVGCEINDLCRYMRYGSEAITALTEGKFSWLGSKSNLEAHRRLARWDLELAVRADEMGMPWRNVIPLLAYEACDGEAAQEAAHRKRVIEAGGEPTVVSKRISRAEQAQARADALVAKNLVERRRQRDCFLRQYETGLLRGTDFPAAVEDWRATHGALWSEGRRNRMLYDQKQTITRHVEEAKKVLTRFTPALRERMSTASTTEKKDLAKKIEKCAELVGAAEQVLGQTR